MPSRGVAAVAALVAAAMLSPQAGMAAPAPPAAFADLLSRARQSWAEFEAALGSVLAGEDYRQDARWPRTPAGSAVVRQMRSELLLIQVPGSAEWVTFRQVEEVDGAAPPQPSPSIIATLANTSRPLDTRIGQLVRASAAYNLGDFERTINTPTFAPIVLRWQHVRRVRFRREADTTIDGQRAVIVRFDETARPTIVRGRGTRDVPMRGRLWLASHSGQVLRSALVMKDSFLTATIDVDYGYDDGLGMMVPQVMRERYQRAGHVVTTEARYRDYRRFTTSARIIGR